MAKERPRLDLDFDDLFRQANDHPSTDGAVAGRAGRVAARARRIDQLEGNGDATIFIRERNLPNGRKSYDVVSDDVAGEYGTSERARLRTLRRASREVRR